MTDQSPEQIWLQPACGDACARERLWCEDDIGPCDECGLPCVRYVRAEETSSPPPPSAPASR